MTKSQATLVITYALNVKAMIGEGEHARLMEGINAMRRDFGAGPTFYPAALSVRIAFSAQLYDVERFVSGLNTIAHNKVLDVWTMEEISSLYGMHYPVDHVSGKPLDPAVIGSPAPWHLLAQLLPLQGCRLQVETSQAL